MKTKASPTLSFCLLLAATLAGSPDNTLRADVTATFGGKPLAVETCRVSAMPFNRVWPGYQRSISQTKIAFFVSFDVEESGELLLTLPENTVDVRVHPFRRGGYSREGRILRATVTHPEQFVVEAGGTEIHVFADAPWRYQPRTGERYFAPGVHEAGAIIPKSGERIVIDRGATVYGNLVFLGVTNVTVEGRGILDSSRIARVDESWPGTLAARASGLPGVQSVWGTAPVYAYKCGGLSINGIVFRDSPRWTMNICDSRDILIDGVKVVGQWRYNADGIDICACERSILRNSFIRSFDDCVIARPQLYMAETTPMHDFAVSNCVLWCDWGAAIKVQHGQRACAMRNLRFRDIDCLRTDYTTITVTTRWGSNGCVIGDVSFDDIRVDAPADRVRQQYQKKDDDVFRPVRHSVVTLATVGAYSLGTPAANQGKPGKLPVDFFHFDYHNIAFRNFTVYEAPGKVLSDDSPIGARIDVSANLPHFQVSDLLIEGMPKKTDVKIVGNVKLRNRKN